MARELFGLVATATSVASELADVQADAKALKEKLGETQASIATLLREAKSGQTRLPLKP